MHVGRVRRRSPVEEEVLGLLMPVLAAERFRLHSTYSQIGRRPLFVQAGVVASSPVMTLAVRTGRTEAEAAAPDGAWKLADKSSLGNMLVVEVRSLAISDDEQLASLQRV